MYTNKKIKKKLTKEFKILKTKCDKNRRPQTVQSPPNQLREYMSGKCYLLLWFGFHVAVDATGIGGYSGNRVMLSKLNPCFE